MTGTNHDDPADLLVSLVEHSSLKTVDMLAETGRVRDGRFMDLVVNTLNPELAVYEVRQGMVLVHRGNDLAAAIAAYAGIR